MPLTVPRFVISVKESRRYTMSLVEEFFDNSFWSSGYPIGIAIVLVYFIVRKVWSGQDGK